MFKNKFKSSKGQALLIVLLTLSVVLVVSLSFMARSVTDIGVSSQNEDSLRAFSAAEAGVEEAYISGFSSAQSTITGSSGEAVYNTEVSLAGEGMLTYNYPKSLISGESGTIWFVAHDEAGGTTCDLELENCFTAEKINICWGELGTPSDSDQTPAIEISVFYLAVPGDTSSVKVGRMVVDPNATRRLINKFSANDTSNPNYWDPENPGTMVCNIDGTKYQFFKEVYFGTLGASPLSYNQQNGLQFMRVKMFYNTEATHNFAVDARYNPGPVNPLPSQGKNIISTGVSGTSTRKLDVFQGYSEIPDIFDYSLYSGSDIVYSQE